MYHGYNFVKTSTNFAFLNIFTDWAYPSIVFFKRFIYFTLTCVSVLLAYMSVHYIHAWCLLRSKEGIGSPGSEISDGCELLCGYWDLNLDSLEEQVRLINCWASSSAPILSSLIIQVLKYFYFLIMCICVCWKEGLVPVDTRGVGSLQWNFDVGAKNWILLLLGGVIDILIQLSIWFFLTLRILRTFHSYEVFYGISEFPASLH